MLLSLQRCLGRKLVLLHPWLLWKEESQVVCSSTKEEGPWL